MDAWLIKYVRQYTNIGDEICDGELWEAIELFLPELSSNVYRRLSSKMAKRGSIVEGLTCFLTKSIV